MVQVQVQFSLRTYIESMSTWKNVFSNQEESYKRFHNRFKKQKEKNYTLNPSKSVPLVLKSASKLEWVAS